MEERVAEGSRKVVVIRPGVGVERLARLPPPLANTTVYQLRCCMHANNKPAA